MRILKSRLFVVAVVLGLKVILARWSIFGVAGLSSVGTAVDLSAVVLLAVLVASLPRRGQAAAYIALDVVVSAALLAVVLYSRFFGGVPAPASALLLDDVPSLPISIVRTLRPEHLLLLIDVPVLIAVFLTHAVPSMPRRRTLAAVASVAAALLLIGVAADFMDPGLGYTQGSLQHGLFAAELARSVLSASKARAAVDVSDPVATQRLIEQLRGRESTTAPDAGAARGKNLIVIQVESLQEFPIGRTVNGRPITPELENISAESLSFPDCFTQVSRGNTSDAEFVMNSSLYPCGTTDLALTYAYGDKRFPSLPRLLGASGYDTMTFHANRLSYWNRQNLYPALGFGHAYPLEFFGEEDVIGPGPSDDVLFSKALPVLEREQRSGKRFYAQFVTLTSHYPFELPPEKERLLLPPRYRDSLLGRYLQAVAYDDATIGAFVRALQQDGLWDDSLVVIYGDHAGLPANLPETERELLGQLLGREYTEADRFNIPLLIHVPGLSGRVISRPVGQVDLTPTLASLLGVSLDGQVHFGENALAPGAELLAFRWNEATTFSDDRYFVDEDVPGEGGGVFDVRTKALLPQAKAPEGEADRVRELEQLSDTYVDSLPKR